MDGQNGKNRVIGGGGKKMIWERMEGGGNWRRKVRKQTEKERKKLVKDEKEADDWGHRKGRK